MPLVRFFAAKVWWFFCLVMLARGFLMSVAAPPGYWGSRFSETVRHLVFAPFFLACFALAAYLLATGTVRRER